jgi:CBS-domain-containing membrane protein
VSDFERHASGKEARRAAPGRPWVPAEEQRQDALQRYLGAVAATAATKAAESAPAPEEAPPPGPVRKTPAPAPAPPRVRDVMSVPAVSVTGDTPFLDVAHTLSHEQVSAVPVVDAEDHVIGVVSESDLLAKAAVTAEPHRHGPLGRLRQHRLYEKSRGETAATLMTFPPVTVRPGELVADAAWTAAHARLKRLPVTDHQGRLVGVVSRIDLLRALIRDDAEIHAEVESVIRHQFLLDPETFEVTVEHGVVVLAGRPDAATIPKLLEAVREIEDVVDVVDHLGVG